MSQFNRRLNCDNGRGGRSKILLLRSVYTTKNTLFPLQHQHELYARNNTRLHSLIVVTFVVATLCRAGQAANGPTQPCAQLT